MPRQHTLTALGTLVVSSGLTVVLGFTSTVPQTQTAPPAASGLASISGVVSDEGGTPIAGATVRALRYNRSAGYLRPQDLGSATSDDRGIYRIQSLRPGHDGICAVTNATRPLNEAHRLRAEIDRLLRHLDLAGPNDEFRQESAQQIAALEAKLPDRVDPVYGYAPRCTPQPFSLTPVKMAIGWGKI